MDPLLCKTNMIFLDDNVYIHQAFQIKLLYDINLLHLVIMRSVFLFVHVDDSKMQ